jgi:hypothetical protein
VQGLQQQINTLDSVSGTNLGSGDASVYVGVDQFVFKFKSLKALDNSTGDKITIYDSSVNNRIEFDLSLNKYLKEASIGSSFKWTAGQLDVSLYNAVYAPTFGQLWASNKNYAGGHGDASILSDGLLQGVSSLNGKTLIPNADGVYEIKYSSTVSSTSGTDTVDLSLKINSGDTTIDSHSTVDWSSEAGKRKNMSYPGQFVTLNAGDQITLNSSCGGAVIFKDVMFSIMKIK